MRNAGRRSSASPSSLSAFVGVNAWTSSPELRSTFSLPGSRLVPILALVRIRLLCRARICGCGSALVPDRVVREGTLIGLLAVASLGMGWTLNAPFVMVATLISSTLGLVCAGLAMRRRRPRAIHDILPAYDAAALAPGSDSAPHPRATEAPDEPYRGHLAGWIADTKNAGIYSLPSISLLCHAAANRGEYLVRARDIGSLCAQ